MGRGAVNLLVAPHTPVGGVPGATVRRFWGQMERWARQSSHAARHVVPQGTPIDILDVLKAV